MEIFHLLSQDLTTLVKSVHSLLLELLEFKNNSRTTYISYVSLYLPLTSMHLLISCNHYCCISFFTPASKKSAASNVNQFFVTLVIIFKALWLQLLLLSEKRTDNSNLAWSLGCGVDVKNIPSKLLDKVNRLTKQCEARTIVQKTLSQVTAVHSFFLNGVSKFL